MAFSLHAEPALPADALDRELAGLDALEQSGNRDSVGRRLWSATWPKLVAVGLVLAFWQFAYWREWKPHHTVPAPIDVWRELRGSMADGSMLEAIGLTMKRAAVGFGLAMIIGSVVGVLVSRFRVMRAAIGSFITGIQTMPSIAWFPFAILLFELSERAITFVVVLGAAPSIANGIIAGADQVPPLLVRSGRVLGARGLGLYRTVILPAAVPNVLGGVKQGWAFAWRSLMAGELLVIIRGVNSIGAELQFARDLSDAPRLFAAMVVILVIGIVIDAVVFAGAERFVRRRWGLIDSARA